MGRNFVDMCLQLCIAVLISSPCAPAAVFAASKTSFTAAGNLHLHQSSVLRRASFEPMRIRGGAHATEPTEMPPQDTLVLHYHSTWPTVHIHYSLDGGKTWSVRPGKVPVPIPSTQGLTNKNRHSVHSHSGPFGRTRCNAPGADPLPSAPFPRPPSLTSRHRLHRSICAR